MRIVNVEILRHPLNWVTVTLMVAFAAVAFHIVASHYKAVQTPN